MQDVTRVFISRRIAPKKISSRLRELKQITQIIVFYLRDLSRVVAFS
jgi:hypothetical protein